jgi:hypothetical protein
LEFATSVCDPRAESPLISWHSTEEIWQRIFYRVGNARFTLPVKKETAVCDLALTLQTQQDGVTEIGFKATTRRTYRDMVFILFNSDSPSKLLTHGGDIGIR